MAKKSGPKPRSDAAERSRQVLFRMGDTYAYFDDRAAHASASATARRDLRRYWTLTDHALRGSKIVPSDVERVGRELLRSELFMKLDVAPVIATYLDSYALDINAPSLVNLSTAEAVAVADLYARSATPEEAAKMLAEAQSGTTAES